MSILRRIRKQGVIHLTETLFNRFVPAWLFRFSIGDVLEMDPEKLSRVLPSLENDEFSLACVQQGPERDVLRKTTWNSVPEELSSNDFGYSISKADDANVLGGVWGGIESFHESNLGFQIQFDEQQSWIYCAYVDKSARGMGVYKRVLSFAANDLSSRGYKRILVMIQPWNKASMYIHRAYCQKKIGRVLVLRVFSLCSVFTFGAVKKDRTFSVKPFLDPVQLQIR